MKDFLDLDYSIDIQIDNLFKHGNEKWLYVSKANYLLHLIKQNSYERGYVKPEIQKILYKTLMCFEAEYRIIKGDQFDSLLTMMDSPDKQDNELAYNIIEINRIKLLRKMKKYKQVWT